MIFAKTALLPTGWASDVLIRLDRGRIASVQVGAVPQGQRVDILLPAMVRKPVAAYNVAANDNPCAAICNRHKHRNEYSAALHVYRNTNGI